MTHCSDTSAFHRMFIAPSCALPSPLNSMHACWGPQKPRTRADATQVQCSLPRLTVTMHSRLDLFTAPYTWQMPQSQTHSCMHSPARSSITLYSSLTQAVQMYCTPYCPLYCQPLYSGLSGLWPCPHLYSQQACPFAGQLLGWREVLRLGCMTAAAGTLLPPLSLSATDLELTTTT